MLFGVVGLAACGPLGKDQSIGSAPFDDIQADPPPEQNPDAKWPDPNPNITIPTPTCDDCPPAGCCEEAVADGFDAGTDGGVE